jgi:hypothetical protein
LDKVFSLGLGRAQSIGGPRDIPEPMWRRQQREVKKTEPVLLQAVTMLQTLPPPMLEGHK